MIATLPSADRPAEYPNSLSKATSLGCILLPCCVQLATPVRANIHMAPSLVVLSGPPMRRTLPSHDEATEAPKWVVLIASDGTNLAAWAHVPPVLVKTQTAPIVMLSESAPTIAVFPSSESATEDP